MLHCHWECALPHAAVRVCVVLNCSGVGEERKKEAQHQQKYSATAAHPATSNDEQSVSQSNQHAQLFINSITALHSLDFTLCQFVRVSKGLLFVPFPLALWVSAVPPMLI